jgi:hypothetical protein
MKKGMVIEVSQTAKRFCPAAQRCRFGYVGKTIEGFFLNRNAVASFWVFVSVRSLLVATQLGLDIIAMNLFPG